MPKIKVKRFIWGWDGVLSTAEHLFHTIEEAVTFADDVYAHTIKIYDEMGQVIETKQKHQPGHIQDEIRHHRDTYA